MTVVELRDRDELGSVLLPHLKLGLVEPSRLDGWHVDGVALPADYVEVSLGASAPPVSVA